MTPTQLKTISVTWMVRDGENVIRPVNPGKHYLLADAYDLEHRPSLVEHQHMQHLKFKNEHGALELATDLPPGTYRVEQLRVVWQYRWSEGSVWQTCTPLAYERYKGFKDFQEWNKRWQTRLFITNNN